MSSYIDARPDWFEVIHLYGTKSGWARLKELVEAHEDSVARHRTFVDRIAPAARNIHAYWLARRSPRERLRQLNKAPAPGRNDPCPCGSGKKFKRCQGAPDVAVFGLTPAKYQSGENDRTGAISRCGDEMMRIMLYEAAYSITSSAAVNSVGGKVRRSILAVWWLMTSSNLLACTTGRSAGFAPLRMRPA